MFLVRAFFTGLTLKIISGWWSYFFSVKIQLLATASKNWNWNSFSIDEPMLQSFSSHHKFYLQRYSDHALQKIRKCHEQRTLSLKMDFLLSLWYKSFGCLLKKTPLFVSLTRRTFPFANTSTTWNFFGR